MAIQNVIAQQNSISKIGGNTQGGALFKKVLEQKKPALPQANSLAMSQPQNSMASASNMVRKMISNHEQATKSVRASMVRTNYTPEKLLKMQYKTGFLFLREQMFCKTAELSANTFKSFTQMQV